MQRVHIGDIISVDYVGTINQDEIFETTQDTGPLEFEVGAGAVFPAFETAVLNMAVNERKAISIQPREAYGEKIPELIHTMDVKNLGENITPKPGMVLSMNINHEGQSQQVPALLTEIEGNQVTVDFNHPLAGKALNYDITVTAIKRPAKQTGNTGAAG